MVRTLPRAARLCLFLGTAMLLNCGDDPAQPPADTTPPAIRILTPSAGAVLGQSPLVTLEASDDGGLERVEVAIYPIGLSGHVESDSIVAASGALDAPYAYTWDTTAVPNGPYAILASAADAAANSASDTVRVGVDIDRDPPVVTITPTDAAVVSGIVGIEIGVTDASRIEAVGVAVYDSLGTALVTQTFTNPPYELSWDTRLLARGAYRICAAASDTLGHTSAEVCHTVQSYPPRRLRYDDGRIDEQRGTPGSSYQIASLFQNPFDVPVRIDTVECVIGGATIPGASFRFVVWGTSGRVPTTPVAMSGVLNAASGQHVGIYTSLGTVIPAGGFFAAGLQQAGSSLLAIGVDTSSIFTTNTFWLATPAGSTNWVALEQLGDIVIPMIRVCVSAVNTSGAVAGARVESGYGVRRSGDDVAGSARLRPWSSPPSR